MTDNICDLVVLAAGLGTRFGEKKQFFEVDGKTILLMTLDVVRDLSFVRRIVVVVPNDDVEVVQELIEGISPKVSVIGGGSSRFLSSRNAVQYLAQEASPDVVLIHDGVRPFVSCETFSALYQAMRSEKHDGYVLSLPIHDSVIQFSDDKEVAHSYVDRSSIARVQTPHIYNFAKLLAVLNEEDVYSNRENAEILFSSGHRLGFLEGDPLNVKITTRADLRFFHGFK